MMNSPLPYTNGNCFSSAKITSKSPSAHSDGFAFRSAVSGYNKKDVNDYIAHLGENLAGCMKERDDLALQLSALGAQLDEVLAKNAALQAQLKK